VVDVERRRELVLGSVEAVTGSLGRTVGVGGLVGREEDVFGGRLDAKDCDCADCCSWTREVNGMEGDGSGFFHGDAPGVEIFGDGKPLLDGRP
jgi:hypothetical protein